MAQKPTGDENSDDLLKRADALLARHHRQAAAPPADGPAPASAGDVPLLTVIVGNEAGASDIPVLTEIVVPESQAGRAAPAADGESAPANAQSAPRTEIVSRVQAQNLEHKVYLKLRKGLDQHIAGVLQERFMPNIGAALDQALQKITLDLQSNISDMVRASIEDTLQTQLRNLQISLQPAAAAPPEAPAASGIMPPSPESPSPASHMELAKSFEPAAIEARWYPAWESSGYFKAGLDPAKAGSFLHPAAAAQRHRHAAHGPWLQPDPHGCADPLPPHARRQHAVAARHRSRRHRHPDRGRAPARSAGPFAPRSRPREVRRKGLGVEGILRLHHHPPDAPARHLLRLVARALHHGRRGCRRSSPRPSSDSTTKA